MPISKSYAELVLGTLAALLKDCAVWYPDLAREFDRDFQRLSSAVECHGIKFVLDVMPAYRKHLDKCLDTRRLTSSCLTHFGPDRRSGVIPRLFRGLTLRVFDREGSMKPSPDVLAIRLLRQLLGACRKLRLACGPKQCANAVRDFIRVDSTVRAGDLNWSAGPDFDSAPSKTLSFTDLVNVEASSSLPLFGETSCYGRENFELLRNVQRVSDIISAALGPFDPSLYRFRHGPGAVADHRYGTYKYVFDQWPTRLEAVFPYSAFAVANYAERELTECSDTLSFRKESPAKLCAVPKTISKPRLIASEPSYLQWCQQSLRDYFYTQVNRTFLSQFVSFNDQGKNGRLALQASIDRTHSTIDLSEASDRVSCWHVERLFRQCPTLLDGLQASRSVFIKQDICKYSPGWLSVRKYSTMGNATTFPVQSLFFLALALASVLTVRRMRVDQKSIRSLGASQVRVFGDDIIVPSDGFEVLLGLLQALSLKVNVAKTFGTGQFRESCGVDAFAGVNVTSVNVLDYPDRSRPGSIVSTVDVHKNLCNGGFVHTARYLRMATPAYIRNRIRTVEAESGDFGWASLEAGPDDSYLRYRWNADLQRREVLCLGLATKTKRSLPTVGAGLLQFFTEAVKEVTASKSTLGFLRQRPKARLRLGWVATS